MEPIENEKEGGISMKVRFLGTAAAEGWPAVFCNCENCKKAAALGGKNVRTRSQILVNDDLLIDLPPDTYLHKLAYGLDLSKVHTLLVTHSHMDHFYPMELSMRGSCYAHDMQSPFLDVFCDEKVKESFLLSSGFEKFGDEVYNAIRWHVMPQFGSARSGDYEIYAFKARHAFQEKALFFLIRQGEKAFMQCNDTGYFYEENFAFLEKIGIKPDFVALDCTNGKLSFGKEGTHMGAAECEELVTRLRKDGLVKKDTVFAVTHFSHNGALTHEELEKHFASLGVAVAYDGWETEI